jgi:hypothetical protein
MCHAFSPLTEQAVFIAALAICMTDWITLRLLFHACLSANFTYQQIGGKRPRPGLPGADRDAWLRGICAACPAPQFGLGNGAVRESL